MVNLVGAGGGGGRNNLRLMSTFQNGGFGGTTFPSTAAATFPHYAIQQGIPFNLYGYIIFFFFL